MGETVSGSEENASVLITANKARLAGWELIPGRLSSGTVADINGNNASIALGTGATTATGTPTDGLFFVSASTSPVFYVGSTFSYVDDVLTAGGWKIGKGQISSSNGQAILSGSGVLSLGTGTHNYAQSNRTYIDGPGNRMSIGRYFQFSSNVLNVADWEIGDKKIIYNDSGTERFRLDALTGDVQIDGDDALGIILGDVGAGISLDSETSIPVFFGTKEDGSQSVFRVGSTSAFMKFDSGVGFEVSSSKFQIKTDGDVVVRKVDAVAGTIGGFSITNSAISSSSTPKRGLILKPGDSIKGFGTTAHTLRSAQGKFSFGVGAIAPPEGADVQWNSDMAAAPGGDISL